MALSTLAYSLMVFYEKVNHYLRSLRAGEPLRRHMDRERLGSSGLCQRRPAVRFVRGSRRAPPAKGEMTVEPSSYEQQKKYFTNRKQLRVWVELEKYQEFEAAVKAQGKSIYSVINQFIDDFCGEGEKG